MNDFNNFNNPQVARLPQHLKQFIVEQHYEKYTSIDNAVWRYVMRQNYSYLKDVAYYPYIPGLHKAGLTIEKIPSLQEMNDALGKIGWGAVTVDGFIPPAAFMEYQAYRVLVIAADIRQLRHIEYTPAPDIIHESAGHAPIIADPNYNQYLSYFGSIGAKAMFSSRDFELYEAIRELSILKEMPDADSADIEKAQKNVEYCQENLGEPSEMALLSRLHWWTVEYGLIGTLEEPKIYGAGLLSSIGESASCMKPEVKKLWYTSDAVNYTYDITKEQPQLFVTPTFQNLVNVLEDFANKMAFRRGGTEGLLKAIECKNVCTAVYTSGLQVSGVFAELISNDNTIHFIKTTGPTALSFENKQLTVHDKNYHKDGFSSPVGKLQGNPRSLENWSIYELNEAGIIEGQQTSLCFESGIKVKGLVSGITIKNQKVLMITFTNCTVKDKEDKIYFEPEWGNYDMAVGEKIASVFCGAADKDSFEEIPLMSDTKTHHHHYTDDEKLYQQLFQTVRDIREQQSNYEKLPEVWMSLKGSFTDDWLCSLEVLELLEQENIYANVAKEITDYLDRKADTQPAYKKLITDGFYLIKHPVTELAIPKV
ncbi:aromatic amino acid hydroxylase [Segetibacter sp.]|jgi:phenylalanine-4-hydroxylase|uniref:aromatic amino acid hydroxylase n=1 Tax=Segetibacter sp. TaxID=2231182 RepID=UPI00260D844E|nr:aromatic amino acid hydroxylase [Segetibacter sp.]MCW3080359.1 aromatic amino acid hydroxylase [Segetibacter sp.]